MKKNYLLRRLLNLENMLLTKLELKQKDHLILSI